MRKLRLMKIEVFFFSRKHYKDTKPCQLVFSSFLYEDSLRLQENNCYNISKSYQIPFCPSFFPAFLPPFPPSSTISFKSKQFN